MGRLNSERAMLFSLLNDPFNPTIKGTRNMTQNMSQFSYFINLFKNINNKSVHNCIVIHQICMPVKNYDNNFLNEIKIQKFGEVVCQVTWRLDWIIYLYRKICLYYNLPILFPRHIADNFECVNLRLEIIGRSCLKFLYSEGFKDNVFDDWWKWCLNFRINI